MKKTLKHRYMEAREEGRQHCRYAGHHTWDKVDGFLRKMTGGWAVAGIDGKNDLHEYEAYVRTCVICGEEQEADSPLPWLAEAGLGRFVCDPVSGKVRFVKTANVKGETQT